MVQKAERISRKIAGCALLSVVVIVSIPGATIAGILESGNRLTEATIGKRSITLTNFNACIAFGPAILILDRKHC